MKVPTASLSSIITPDKRDNLLISSANMAMSPFPKAKLSRCNEDTQQPLQSKHKVEQSKALRLNSRSLIRTEIARMNTTGGQSLQRPKFTISAVGMDVNCGSNFTVKVEDVTHGLRRPVASLQKLKPKRIRDLDHCHDGFQSFNQAMNLESTCSPATSDPFELEADRPSTPVQRRISLPALSTPLGQTTKLCSPHESVKRLFSSSENLKRHTLEVSKFDEPKNKDVLNVEEIKESSTTKQQSLEDSIAKLTKKLATISMKTDNLNRESAFYKTVIFKIENIIARSQDQSVFSSLRITNF